MPRAGAVLFWRENFFEPLPWKGELLNRVLKNIPFYKQFNHLATSKNGSKRDITFNNKAVKILQIKPP